MTVNRPWRGATLGASGLLVSGGLAPLILGPGYYPVQSWIVLPCVVLILLGVLVASVESFFIFEARRAHHVPLARRSRTWRTGTIATSATLFVVFLSLAAGWIPNLY